MIDNSDLRRIIDQAKEKIKSLESENKSLKNELSRLSELRTEYRNLLNSYELWDIPKRIKKERIADSPI